MSVLGISELVRALRWGWYCMLCSRLWRNRNSQGLRLLIRLKLTALYGTTLRTCRTLQGCGMICTAALVAVVNRIALADWFSCCVSHRLTWLTWLTSSINAGVQCWTGRTHSQAGANDTHCWSTARLQNWLADWAWNTLVCQIENRRLRWMS